jgi:hypothetical protein
VRTGQAGLHATSDIPIVEAIVKVAVFRWCGAIEIESNWPTDAVSREAIRQHLTVIAAKFSQGDFAIPMFIHATVPPGVETMKQLKSKGAVVENNGKEGLSHGFSMAPEVIRADSRN